MLAKRPLHCVRLDCFAEYRCFFNSAQPQKLNLIRSMRSVSVGLLLPTTAAVVTAGRMRFCGAK